VLVAGIALVVAFPVKNPEKVGEGTGQFAVFVMAVALGASYLAQTGRKAAAIAVSVVVVGLVVGMVVVVVMAVHSQPKLTASMRAPLVAMDEWLEHPGLGFKIHAPGPGFKEAPMYADMMRASDPGDDIIYHAYADAEPTAVLVVAVMARDLDSRTELEQTISGVEHGMRAEAARQMPGTEPHVVERTVGDRDATLHLAIGPAHFRMHMFSFPDGKHPYAVMLLVMSRSPDALAPVLSEIKR